MIDQGSKDFGFKKTTSLNIGNPQAVGQGNLSFNREVLALMLHPELKNDITVISEDAKKRARRYWKMLDSPVGKKIR